MFQYSNPQRQAQSLIKFQRIGYECSYIASSLMKSFLAGQIIELTETRSEICSVWRYCPIILNFVIKKKDKEGKERARDDLCLSVGRKKGGEKIPT